MPVLFLLSGPKMVFRPATRFPDKREIWHGGADLRSAPSSVPNFMFIGAEMWEYSPQNCQNFEFWPEICTSGATRLQYFLRSSQRLYASIGSLAFVYSLITFEGQTPKL